MISSPSPDLLFFISTGLVSRTSPMVTIMLPCPYMSRDKQSIPRKKQQTGPPLPRPFPSHSSPPPPPRLSSSTPFSLVSRHEKRTKRGATDFDPVPNASHARRRPVLAPVSAPPPGSGERAAENLRSERGPAIRRDLFALAPDWRLPFPLLFSLRVSRRVCSTLVGFRLAPGFLRFGLHLRGPDLAAFSRVVLFCTKTLSLCPRKRLAVALDVEL